VKKFVLRCIVLLYPILLLLACFGPNTPQEVTQAFWKSVVNNDAGKAVEYSTLVDVKQYDRFSKDWDGFRPSWGKVVIEGDEASVESRFSKSGDAQADNREFITYLVRRNGKWIIDYARTNEAVQGGVFSNLVEKLSRAGKDISAQFGITANDFNGEMERYGKKLEKMSGELNRQATEIIEKFSADLRNSIKELEESINRALEEQDKNLSERDRRVLHEVATDLNNDSENLSQPGIQPIAYGSKDIAMAQQRLDSIDDQVAGKYKKQWHEWSEKIEAAMKNMLDELSEAIKG